MSEEPKGRSRAEPLTIGLGVTAALLAVALVGVLTVGGRRDGEVQAEGLTTTTSTTTTIPSSTTLVLGDSIDGIWELADPSTGSGRMLAGTFVVETQRLVTFEAEVDGGVGQVVELALFDGSLIYPAPTVETPSSLELRLELVLNGVLRRQRTVAVVTPSDDQLTMSFELTIDPAEFDLAGSPDRLSFTGSFERL